jgi:hypothetical protein
VRAELHGEHVISKISHDRGPTWPSSDLSLKSDSSFLTALWLAESKLCWLELSFGDKSGQTEPARNDTSKVLSRRVMSR